MMSSLVRPDVATEFAMRAGGPDTAFAIMPALAMELALKWLMAAWWYGSKWPSTCSFFLTWKWNILFIVKTLEIYKTENNCLVPINHLLSIRIDFCKAPPSIIVNPTIITDSSNFKLEHPNFLWLFMFYVPYHVSCWVVIITCLFYLGWLIYQVKACDFFSHFNPLYFLTFNEINLKTAVRI